MAVDDHPDSPGVDDAARRAEALALAEEACCAAERWSREYFPPDLHCRPELVWVKGAPAGLDNVWAMGFCPLIYQHRDELAQFFYRLALLGPRRCAVEIGLEHGGLHVALRRLYEKVVTVERSHFKVLQFVSRLPGDGRSVLVCGESQLRHTMQAVTAACAGPADLLFIDGGHRYQDVYADYFVYRPLIRPGGVIAWHDTAGRSEDHLGISIFLARLRAGELDGRPHAVEDIILTGTGISYEIVPG